ncbi:MAG: hypothetical protein N2Z63_06900, partial [Thiobacillaceae bacterium]|nr:hypothetical protein [Thiobacillaceae bacterium]
AAPQAVPLSAFEHGIEAFVETVLARLSALGHEQTDLAELWRIVCADRADRTQASVRRIEARLGYDPEGCPPELLKSVVSIEQKIGEAAMAELAPVCGAEGRNDIDGLQRLATDAGVSISPKVPYVEVAADVRPWQQGVLAARRVRERLAKPEECIKDRDLNALLGVVGPSWPDMVMQVDRPVSVVRPHTNDRGRGWVFIPRKRHRYGRRFEYARVLGDFATYAAQPNEWRPVTDLYTTRQKRQRAFAAELLCPIDGLRVFLDDDLSESAIDEASHHYQVSEQVVRMQLINAGLLPNFEPPPYVSGRDGVLPS